MKDPVSITTGVPPYYVPIAIYKDITASGGFSYPTKMHGDFNVTVSGTFVGTVILQRSFNGTDWVNLTTAEGVVLSFTTPASFTQTEVEGGVYYRLYVSAYTSGTIHVRLSQ